VVLIGGNKTNKPILCIVFIAMCGISLLVEVSPLSMAHATKASVVYGVPEVANFATVGL
jgi:hypothetical protein